MTLIFRHSLGCVLNKSIWKMLLCNVIIISIFPTFILRSAAICVYHKIMIVFRFPPKLHFLLCNEFCVSLNYTFLMFQAKAMLLRWQQPKPLDSRLQAICYQNKTSLLFLSCGSSIKRRKTREPSITPFGGQPN